MHDLVFPTGNHPQRFDRSAEDRGRKEPTQLDHDENTVVSGGGEMESWGDFALQTELEKDKEEDDFQI
ncbi:hypothetical protein FTV88_0015 [Heliorestis convoluta]|uniref:Uncharacterized protein n=1 Tax=Heliorestis convoluta TaxID=356322 RepID=A0A5Q2MVH3_9FIRM|nr:hypothetical protein FTV88_0015 [Heliorestis convoluta]